ncbi:hypothetical protein [Paraflavitalea speifideaquila]|uniref:hypothetical protein n=1 Tax=Paraflavitalea speifideaquila TaxID=3076558 RepID=UPI0028EFB2DE|nr:hypothetical protein [Paraflavitalea speifideiaquila]
MVKPNGRIRSAPLDLSPEAANLPAPTVHIPDAVFSQYVPKNAQSAGVVQDDDGIWVTGADVNGRPYKNAVFKFPKSHQLTWVDKLIVGLQDEKLKYFNQINSQNPVPTMVAENPVAKSPSNSIDNTNDDKAEKLLYRGGSFTDLNFTPRPDQDDNDESDPKSGWSTFTTPEAATRGKGGKFKS